MPIEPHDDRIGARPSGSSLSHPAAQRPDQVHSVCVFAASADSVSTEHRTLARELGAALATAGWRTVYGGGQAGLMGELAHGALAADGLVTGVIPRQLNSRELALDAVTELVLVDSLAERKQLMDARSDAFAILPGGIGTLDELTDVLTTLHLGFHSRPVVLVDPDGFWDPLHELLAHMVAADVLPAASLAMLTTARSTAEALELLRPSA